MRVDCEALSASRASDSSSPFLLFFDLAQLPVRETMVALSSLTESFDGSPLLCTRALSAARTSGRFFAQKRAPRSAFLASAARARSIRSV